MLTNREVVFICFLMWIYNLSELIKGLLNAYH